VQTPPEWVGCNDYLREEKAIMKITKLAMLVLTIALALFILIPNLSWAAEDGAALYKAKCSACHKADGAGNPAMKAPALNTPEFAKKDTKTVVDAVAKNAKHASVKSLPEAQLKAAVEFAKGLAKK
jgi:mono/diheme cytochrome c family protein